MSKIAIDVALIPPKEILDLAINLNKTFTPLSAFNDKNNLPHITLAMGVIEKTRIDLINKKLGEISEKFNSIDLEISKVSTHIKPDGKKSFYFEIKPSKELADLHGEIMKQLDSILTHKVEIEMFNQDQPVEPISKYWVENYKKDHQNPENFQGHISLKCKNEPVYDQLPLKFRASKLTLCHLGNLCTCREIFGSYELK